MDSGEEGIVELYIIRHADALPLGANGIKNDADRPLSDRGWKQADWVGRALKKRSMRLDLIATSPLVRAVQTAQQIRSVYQLTEEQVPIRDELTPDFRPKILAEYLNGLAAESMAIVGHQPDLSRFIGWLIGDKDVAIDMAKAAVALIQAERPLEKGAGTLMWLLTPEWMEAIA